MQIHAFKNKFNYLEDPLVKNELNNIAALVRDFPEESEGIEKIFDKDFDVLIGAGTADNPWPSMNRYDRPDRKNILLDYECTAGWNAWEHKFDKILHIDPHTCEWRNKKLGHQKYEYVYFPVSPRDFHDEREKVYDVIYSGGLGCRDMTRDGEIIRQIISPMANFKHAMVSFHAGGIPKGINLTHRDVNYRDKLLAVSQSKITMVHNVYWGVYPGTRRYNHLTDGHKNCSCPCSKVIGGHEDWRENFAFSDIQKPGGGTGHVPQLKSRAFEAAAGRSLILAKKDPFNILERWFKPGVHFVYLDKDHPAEQIAHILENYDSKYREIAYAAHDLCRKKYTTINFYRDFVLPFAESLSQ